MERHIHFSGVSKVYVTEGVEQRALDDISFTINEGEFVIILGQSGTGKSTLLNLLGGMDQVTAGEIQVGGIHLHGLGENSLADYRANQVGFIFQFYNLIPTLTAYENVSLIKEIVKDSIPAGEIMKAVGLEAHMNKFPPQLSGGEQQRVSIARALSKNPALILGDEPTGALDSMTGIQIVTLLKIMCRERRKTVIIVTHNAALAECADKVIRLSNGRIKEIIRNEAPKEIDEISW